MDCVARVLCGPPRHRFEVFFEEANNRTFAVAGHTRVAIPFFFNDTATTEIYTLSLHDALPISSRPFRKSTRGGAAPPSLAHAGSVLDRKSTRLNSSHLGISYAVFCLKKKR